MRFKGMTLMASVMVMSACGGEKAPEAAPPAAPPATPAPAATGTVAPITGKMIDVKMIGDDKGYRFEPANFTAKVGDGIKFTVAGTIGPHNVAFDATKIPAAAKAQLDANFGTDRLGELSGGLKMNAGETFTLSLGGLVPGTYEYNCTPHLAMNMKGTITITR